MVKAKTAPVSLIIPVYNEEKYIERCLESILKQTLKPKEIIIVDDGSNDNSFRIVENLKSQISNLKLIKQKHQGPAEGRNLGASNTKGDILVFLDADMSYEKNFIKELIKPIISEREVATFTRSEYVANLENRWARFWDETIFGSKGRRGLITDSDRGGAFRAISANAFNSVNGYESYGTSDDASVLSKLGKTAKSVDSAVCYHYNPSTLSEVFYSARWMGRDIHNRSKPLKFLIYSPIWSMLKSFFNAVIKGDPYIILFKTIFDTGYLLGLIDINWRRVYHK